MRRIRNADIKERVRAHHPPCGFGLAGLTLYVLCAQIIMGVFGTVLVALIITAIYFMVAGGS